jgi:hypothetical protein
MMKLIFSLTLISCSLLALAKYLHYIDWAWALVFFPIWGSGYIFFALTIITMYLITGDHKDL